MIEQAASRQRPWLVALLCAALMAGAPWVFTSSLSLALLTQMGIAIIICLSYNILFGQGGMLSFGHAVYSGLGAYLTLHTLRLVAGEGWLLPVSLLPLAGGLAAMAFAALAGWVTTRRPGTAFAMITLGVGELVWAGALMLPEVFGGEGGLTANRVTGAQPWGISFGPQWQVYYLVAAYTLACAGLMYGFTRTPLGRLLNAVRDNPQRVDFLGHDPHMVRYLAFLVAGFFAGIGGGLAALNFEHVSTEMLGAQRSGTYLLFTFLGGAGFFMGPVLGAVLMVLALTVLSSWTQAGWLYIGLVFVLAVMQAPGGLASLAASAWQARQGPRARGWPLALLGLALTAALSLCGVSALIEMAYHLKLDAALGAPLVLWGLALDPAVADHWAGAALLALTGGGLFLVARHQWRNQWRHHRRLLAAQA